MTYNVKGLKQDRNDLRLALKTWAKKGKLKAWATELLVRYAVALGEATKCER